jgi:hypothetical protein
MLLTNDGSGNSSPSATCVYPQRVGGTGGEVFWWRQERDSGDRAEQRWKERMAVLHYTQKSSVPCNAAQRVGGNG